MVVRGAGVESVLHTVRMAVMAQAGASGILVEGARPFGRLRDFRTDFEGVPSLATLTLLFKGVDFEGVFCSARGVGAAFEGVLPPTNALVGVVCAEAVRAGVPATEPLADRLMPVELDERDRSRYE